MWRSSSINSQPPSLNRQTLSDVITRGKGFCGNMNGDHNCNLSYPDVWCCYSQRKTKAEVLYFSVKLKWGTGRVPVCPCLLCFLSLVAYGGQGGVVVYWLSRGPLRRSSKTNNQWEVKLLQCHSVNPRWCHHTSYAKFCSWILTRTKMFSNTSVGVRASRHGWTSRINHTSMTESV